jgi:catechol 2,3-dioxygenase-like lactoylglutathione lyase family enzyme
VQPINNSTFLSKKNSERWGLLAQLEFEKFVGGIMAKIPTTPIDMKLEVDVIAVSDVDRSKRFYQSLGWRLDADDAPLEGLRIVQFTPPGSGCSVTFGKGLTSSAPGSAAGALIVSDIEAAHDALVGRGIEVSEVWHGPPFPVEARQPGPDPKRTSYGSFCSFKDPDGNTWLVQEVTTRAPGRV